MSRLGEEEFHLAAHEYVHALVRRAGLRPPTWLNEGLAEFYSTLRPLGGKVIIGEVIPGRRNALLHEKWVPLSTILSVDHRSPYYNEKSKAGSFYNESWALCHMLITTQEYRPGLVAVMKALDQGKTSEEALATAYGKPVNVILVAIEPKRMDARIELAAAQLQDGQPVAAGQILTSIMKSVGPVEAPRFLVIGAYVDLAQGQRDAARTVVERLRQVAATERDRTALAELESRLAQPDPKSGTTPDHK